MANICSFKMMVKGSRDAINELLGQIRCYEASISSETAVGDEILAEVFGECRYSVHACMVDEKNDATLRGLSEKLSLEVEAFGYDISEPEWIEHFHYKNGEVLREFCLPPCVPEDAFDEWEIDLDRSMYEYIDGPGIYVLKQEYNEPFEWDDYEEDMIVTFEMSKYLQ